MINKTPEANRVQVAMVALDAPALPPPRETLETLASLSGMTVNPTSVEVRQGVLTFSLGGNTAAVALMPAPIPWSNLEGPCATAWWWPEAGTRMRGHGSHLLVALAGADSDAVLRSLALTHLTAAVATHVNAAGIYWGSGTLVHDPQVFLEEARGASRENLPVPLWIDFRIEANDDGTRRLFTTGMKAFEKLEIEISHSRHEAAELFNFACSIADYVLSHNAVIRDGHTVGRREEEKVPAAHAPSMWDGEKVVLRLDF